MKNKFLTSSFLMVGGFLAIALAGSASAAGFGFGAGGKFGGPGPAMVSPAAVGKVTAVNGDTITLAGQKSTTYTVDATNATVMKNGTSSTVGAIAVGDMLMVQGTTNGTSVAATKIFDGMGMGRSMMGGRNPGGPIMGTGVFGTVASVNGNMLTVTASNGRFGPHASTSTTPVIYTIDATNATVMKNGTSSTVGAIAVGDTVMVQGTVNGTSVTATKINDGVVPGAGMGPGRGGWGNGTSSAPQAVIQGDGEPVIGGAVTAVNGSSLTVTNKSNVTYTVDASSATVVKGGATSTISSVAVGDNVVIQGTVNGSSITASSVLDQGAAATGNSSGSTPGVHKGLLGSISGFFHHLFGFF